MTGAMAWQWTAVPRLSSPAGPSRITFPPRTLTSPPGGGATKVTRSASPQPGRRLSTPPTWGARQSIMGTGSPWTAPPPLSSPAPPSRRTFRPRIPIRRPWPGSLTPMSRGYLPTDPRWSIPPIWAGAIRVKPGMGSPWTVHRRRSLPVIPNPMISPPKIPTSPPGPAMTTPSSPDSPPTAPSFSIPPSSVEASMTTATGSPWEAAG